MRPMSRAGRESDLSVRLFLNNHDESEIHESIVVIRHASVHVGSAMACPLVAISGGGVGISSNDTRVALIPRAVFSCEDGLREINLGVKRGKSVMTGPARGRGNAPLISHILPGISRHLVAHFDFVHFWFPFLHLKNSLDFHVFPERHQVVERNSRRTFVCTCWKLHQQRCQVSLRISRY